MDGRDCTRCHNRKDWNEFNLQSNGKNGRASVCKTCRQTEANEKYPGLRKALIESGNLAEYRARAAKYSRELRERLRREVMNEYGGGKCFCCNEDHLEFLVIDHINGGGDFHRASLGCKTGGHPFYAKLKQLGFPFRDELRVLCQNCNASYGFYGYCPHKS